MRRKIMVGFVSGETRFVGYLVALSRNGLIMRCAENSEPGTIGRLGIVMGTEIFRVVAVVRRRIARVGLHFKFLRMSSRDRTLLRRLLQQTGRD
jgi:hypothetical protein